jgi:hypothetical protein
MHAEGRVGEIADWTIRGYSNLTVTGEFRIEKDSLKQWIDWQIRFPLLYRWLESKDHHFGDSGFKSLGYLIATLHRTTQQVPPRLIGCARAGLASGR